MSNVILTSYFNSNPDPQRKEFWTGDVRAMLPLIESCEKLGIKVIVFHDCFFVGDDNFIRVGEQHEYSPNSYRWMVYEIFLKENKFDNIFMVDSTDVEVLNNPFLNIDKNKLYSGNEFEKYVSNHWMRTTQANLLKIPDYKDIIEENQEEVLPNCGIVGGGYDTVMEYLSYRSDLHQEYTAGILKSTDMSIHNYIVWKYFKGRLETGSHINTRFKQFEYTDAWFKHK